MSTIWKLLDASMIPIITYGAEAWTPTKAEKGALQKILDNIIKRILKTPTITPSELNRADLIKAALCPNEVLAKARGFSGALLVRRPTVCARRSTFSVESRRTIREVRQYTGGANTTGRRGKFGSCAI